MWLGGRSWDRGSAWHSYETYIICQVEADGLAV